MMRTVPVLACLTLALATPVSGQALKNHNSNAPVDVEADRIEVQDRADRAYFVGNVRVRQGEMTMNAARLTVAYANAGSGTQIQRLDATGGVTVTSATETARGDVAIYDLPRRLITMVGGVVLNQRGSEVRGGRLVINLDSGRATVDGRSSGKPGVEGSTGGRVTGHFTVEKRDTPPPK